MGDFFSSTVRYNFAHLPKINGIDTFWTDKENGVAYARPTKYEDIHMPTNCAAGFIIAMFITVMGFALIWQIWWLVFCYLYRCNDQLHRELFHEESGL